MVEKNILEEVAKDFLIKEKGTIDSSIFNQVYSEVSRKYSTEMPLIKKSLRFVVALRMI